MRGRAFTWLLHLRTGDARSERERQHEVRTTNLGDGLGAFRDGVLSKLTGKDKTDSSLDLA